MNAITEDPEEDPITMDHKKDPTKHWHHHVGHSENDRESSGD